MISNKKYKKNKEKESKKINSKPRYNSRKVIRPNYIDLINDINQFGYSATGRKYGVSDNAIRKWVKNYEMVLCFSCELCFFNYIKHNYI